MVRNNNSKSMDPDSTENGCAHEHFDFLVLDVTLEMNIETLFQLIFTNSTFYKNFLKIRQTYDVEYENWPTDIKEDGSKTRTLKYTLSINYSIGPKSTPSTEIQIMYGESIPGKNYLIDANCQNHAIPYAEHFYTSVRYCIKSLGEERTSVYITGKIIYMKTPWPFIKSLIEKTVVTGCITNFKVLSELLQDECSPKTSKKYQNFGYSRGDIMRAPLRHKKKHGKSPNSPNSSQFYSNESEVSNRICDIKNNSNTEDVAKILLIILLVLTAVNFCLYYQLTTLETIVQKIFQKSQQNLKF